MPDSETSPALPDDSAPVRATPVEPARSSARESIVIFAVVAAILVGVVVWMKIRAKDVTGATKSAEPLATQYVGEASCRACHPGESALFHRSGHAQTLRLASDRVELAQWLDGRKATDFEYPDAVFTYRLQDGKIEVERVSPGSKEKRSIEFAFGSGHHATTFVTVDDPNPKSFSALEHRLTYFAGDRRLGVTPGQSTVSDVDPADKTPIGRLLDERHARRCFDCHTTRLSDQNQTTLDVKTMIPNVSCERCHGPGKAHVEAARRGEPNLKVPFGSGRNTARQQMMLCGHCHRLADMAPPGSIRPDNDELARFQPVGLMLSACYKKSDGALSCTTCHNPHRRASTVTAEYEAVCIRCHQSAPKQVVCKVSAESGCIGCHMPKRDAGQRILFADHWIRIHPRPASTK